MRTRLLGTQVAPSECSGDFLGSLLFRSGQTFPSQAFSFHFFQGEWFSSSFWVGHRVYVGLQGWVYMGSSTQLAAAQGAPLVPQTLFKAAASSRCLEDATRKNCSSGGESLTFENIFFVLHSLMIQWGDYWTWSCVTGHRYWGRSGVIFKLGLGRPRSCHCRWNTSRSCCVVSAKGHFLSWFHLKKMSHFKKNVKKKYTLELFQGEFLTRSFH